MDSFQPKAILLDLDNTILASGSLSEECWRRVYDRLAPRIDGLGIEKLLITVGEVGSWYWSDAERHTRGRFNPGIARREIVSLTFARLGIDAPEMAHELADSFLDEREKAVAPYAGAIETLKHFRNRGYRLALLTNGGSQSQRTKIDRFNLVPFFDCILIEGEFGAGKPDERVFLHALKQLNATAQESWMVGDDLERDITGAQALGIFTVWVDWEDEGLPTLATIQPDRTIRTLAELML